MTDEETRPQSEKVLGILKAVRGLGRLEFLLITLERVIVARQQAEVPGPYVAQGSILDLFLGLAREYETSKALQELATEEEQMKTVKVEDVLEADKRNFAIPNSQISRVVLRSHLHWLTRARMIDLNITAGKKEYKWYALRWPSLKRGFTDQQELVGYCENLLRQVFGEKFSFLEK